MSSPSSRDLPLDRLSTSDQSGRRIYLYPAEVRGKFRKYRAITHFVLILFFLALPWLRIRGQQAVLLDIINRRFSLFGVTFWAHDAPMLVFVLGGAFLILGLVTALWGRVWCGWACPQTVFIDSVFRRIERWIEGDYIARRKLDSAPWSTESVLKKTLKWFAFLAATLLIAHSFIAFFVGTEQLAQMISRSPTENPSSFLAMLAVTGIILFDFGWFREQFCTVVCPYGRFQSLLMDDHSLLVVYDTKRGEPRKGNEPAGTARGDCVNCYRCVRVCPTGIDIRRGTQLECIACTACIDACDDVMARTNKPSGLIRYDSSIGLQGEKAKTIRSRTLVYALLIAVTFGGLVTTLASRRLIEAAFVRTADSPYQEIQTTDGKHEITNRFKVELSNQSFADAELDVVPSSDDLQRGIEVIIATRPTPVGAGKRKAVEFFVKFEKALLSNGKVTVHLNITSHSNVIISEEITLVGPYL